MDIICYLSLLFLMSVSCNLVITCWEAVDLLSFSYVILSYCFVTFLFSVLGQVWYLIVLISDLYLFLTFVKKCNLVFRVNLIFSMLNGNMIIDIKPILLIIRLVSI